MPNIQIQLNFFSLSTQDFSFRVYRQNFKGQPKQEGYYKAKLPVNDGLEVYRDYWLTTETREGFERYYCLASYNPTLTLKVIWDAFLTNLRKNLGPTEYFLKHDSFSRKIAIIIGSHPEGHEVVEIEPYFLKAERKFGFLINFKFRCSEGIENSIKVQQLSLSLKNNLRSNSDYYSDKFDKIQLFIQRFKTRLFPFLIDAEMFDIEKEMLTMQSHSLDTKRYLFKNNQESTSQFQGIKLNGPFSQVDKKPLYIFIFEPSQRVQANDLFSAFIGKAYQGTFAGIEKMFSIPMNKQNIVQLSISSLSKQSLQEVDGALEKIIRQNPDKAIIGVFIINEKMKSNNSDFSPYHYLKYLFTQKQTPLQTVRFEKIMGRDGLKWSIANISLQLFAKLGGKPWKVKPSNEKCLIFGVGCAHKWGEDNKIHKFFAYSVCMDSSGIYRKINVLGESEDKGTYISQLRENIKATINENLDGNYNKCVIHLPFKIKRDEMEYIKSGVNEIATERKDIEFQFIKINTKNKFFGYAQNNSKVPYESNYLQLSSTEFLVWFEGLQYGKENVTKRVGNPVHIEFLEIGSLDSEKKKKYLQDIINLSGANWRGFNAKLAPISIFYPDLIADFIAEFRELADAEVDLNNFYIPWFL